MRLFLAGTERIEADVKAINKMNASGGEKYEIISG